MYDMNGHYLKSCSTNEKLPGGVRSEHTECTQIVRTQIWKCLPAYFAATPSAINALP